MEHYPRLPNEYNQISGANAHGVMNTPSTPLKVEISVSPPDAVTDRISRSKRYKPLPSPNWEQYTSQLERDDWLFYHQDFSIIKSGIANLPAFSPKQVL